MSIRCEYYFTSADQKTLIHVNQWTPLGREIRGVVQIAHGVAEYGARYAPFADYLCKNGYVVVANDHLGHGKSLIEGRPMVYLGDENGWENVVKDIESIRARTAKVFAGKPYFLFGHSMGSFLARTYLIRYPGKLTGCVICGTGHMNALIVAAGKMVADAEIKRLGRASYSERVDQLAFGAYNKRFAPNRTGFDWLSVNEKNVDAYIADPLCGGRSTLGLFRDMMDGIGIITDRANMEKMDKNMPVFFIAGDKDPVGDMGKGVETAYRCFNKAGVQDVSIKLYHGLRHEILNEKTNQYVFLDVLNWLDAHC
ncbi:MAG: lysophospholipase [Oscillospiraceae bacterium]|nr:lysophospholipase [Oscillospiraceae bacterium]